MSVLLGNGNGTFQPQTTYATGIEPDSVAVADVNGDGKPDLVVANYGSDNGERAAGQRQRHVPAAQATFATGASRIRSRWRTSTATASPTSSPPTTAATRVSVLLGNGNGTFQPQTTFATGTEPDLGGGGRRQRRRQARPRRRQLVAATR